MSVTIDPRRHDAVLFDLDAVVTDGGVPVFGSTVALVRQLRQAGVRTAVFSSSRNCAAALAAAGLSDLFDARGGGLAEAADRLAVRPGRSVVVADGEAGVAAGRSGGFALVIGVDRTGTEHGESLRRLGADVVAADLGEVTVRTGDRRMSALPSAMTAIELTATRHPAVFFDFDGTLSDIVDDPDSARLTAGAADALRSLAARCPVAVLSGRDLADVQQRIGLAGIWYAGSHGFELTGPDGTHHQNDAAASALPVLTDAAAGLAAQLDPVAGVVVEHKRFAVAVHYRNAARQNVGDVTAAVRAAGQRCALRVTTGREVIELRPDIDWDKGKTLRWITDRLSRGETGSLLPIYLGDDITDEDAFDAVRRDGVGIIVRHTDDGDRATAASFALDSPRQVSEFAEQLAQHLDR
ncbi:MAG TPA: trehalose-phosphatase [Mycobacterium sp.]|nr:trehalose-phosphatase [Mycobacterium sp.]